MVRSFLFFLLTYCIFCNIKTFSQERKDLGVQAGAAYYVGDFNQGRPLYHPYPSIGAIYRYNLNRFYSLRLSASYGGLKGIYSAGSSYLPNANSSFSKQLIEIKFLGEANFLSFSTVDSKRDKFAPYVTLGLGCAYLGGEIVPNIPFGVGVKYCPLPRLTVGFEWRLHKTFSDKIDNYQNIFDGTKAIFHNNDWFSFMGLFITFRLYNYGNTCPVYK